MSISLSRRNLTRALSIFTHLYNAMNADTHNMKDSPRIPYRDYSKLSAIAGNITSKLKNIVCDTCDIAYDYNQEGYEDVEMGLHKSTVQVYCPHCGHLLFSVSNQLFLRILSEIANQGWNDISVFELTDCRRQLEDKLMKEFAKSKQSKKENDAMNYDWSNPLKTTNTIIKTKNDVKENDNMVKGNKMFKGLGLDFGKVNGDAFRVSHLGLSLKNAQGKYVSYDDNKKQLVDVDFFDFELDDMIYKMPVAHNQVAVGDIILHNGSPVIVTSNIVEEKLSVVDPVAGEEKVILPVKNMFGFNFFTKVLCLIDFKDGFGASSDSPFGNLLPLMLMQGKGDNNNMMQMMMMSSMMSGGKDNPMGNMMSNPLMMMALMGDDNKDMLPMMMMMGNNPFTN